MTHYRSWPNLTVLQGLVSIKPLKRADTSASKKAMVWIWFLPWIAYLIPLVVLGMIGLRATLQVVVVLIPQYRPVVRTVDRVSLAFLRLCLRVLLSALSVTLTVALYGLLVLESVARLALRAVKRAGRRVNGTLLLPIPDVLSLPRFTVRLNRPTTEGLPGPSEVKPVYGPGQPGPANLVDAPYRPPRHNRPTRVHDRRRFSYLASQRPRARRRVGA